MSQQHPQAPVRIGDVILGKFRVDRILGQGGMGIVVGATHLQLDQKVAIKFLLPQALENRETLARFLREARAAVRLKSEHVTRVIDVGQLENGMPYIVMEHLTGAELGQMLQQYGPMPVAVAVDYMLQACEAIAEAHALGIVHRDLKPANLFVTQGAGGRQVVKVLDFGISKSAGTQQDSLMTQTSTVMGSPAYMSPEQMRSAKSVDTRTDIWAIGVILFQLVCGTMPFSGDTFTELCLRIAMDPTPSMPPMPGMPPAFEQVVRRCLEKDPAARFADVSELAAALAAFGPPHAPDLAARVTRALHGDRAQAVLASRTNPGISTMSGSAAQMTVGPQPHRSRTRIILGVAAVTAAAAIGAVVASTRSGGSAAAVTPPTEQPAAATAAVEPAPAAPPVTKVQDPAPAPPPAAPVPVAAPVAAPPAAAVVEPPPPVKTEPPPPAPDVTVTAPAVVRPHQPRPKAAATAPKPEPEPKKKAKEYDPLSSPD